MNKVILQGKIQRIYEGRWVSIVTLFIHGYENNYPQVRFTGEYRENLKNFNEGDFVTIEATIKRRTLRNENDRRYFEQFIKGISIEPAETEMSRKFGKLLNGSYSYKNEVLIEGEVVLAFNNKNVTNVLIRPDDESFNVLVSDFNKKSANAIENTPAGSRVCIKGEIQTVRKRHDDKSRYFENIVVRETAKSPALEVEDNE